MVTPSSLENMRLKALMKVSLAVLPNLWRSASPDFSQARYSAKAPTPILGETASPIGQVPASEMGVRSPCGSNGYSVGPSLAISVVEARKASVVPSGGAAATSWPGRPPEPPGLFSTTTRRPSRRSSWAAICRQMMSVPPLAWKPTSRRSVLLGSAVWARAGSAEAAAAKPNRERRRKWTVLTHHQDAAGA